MPYWIGIDEAGYGPNLGPLTVTATVWRTADDKSGRDIYEHLSDAVTVKPSPRDARLAIADSKLLYRPGKGIAALERGVFAAFALLEEGPRCWAELWEVLCADPLEARCRLPWYCNYDCPLPLEVSLDDLASPIEMLRAGLLAMRAELCAVRSRAVFPAEFNERVSNCNSKSAALSQTTLELLADVLEPLENDLITVVCDKHGARNRYRELLQRAFPEHLIEVRRESAAESIYRFGPAARRVEITFLAKGEGFLPAALASMVCKYLREVCMRALNGYWRTRLPELRPTAGYPTDAKRFRREISALQRELGIDDHILWRSR